MWNKMKSALGGRNIKILIVSFLLSLLATVALATKTVVAMETINYHYLIGTGFLCGLDPSACPDVSKASNGDVIELIGKGTLSIYPKTVGGGGTFKHRDANGKLLAEGVWKAEQLLSFHSYGSGSVQGLPKELEGGLGLIRVGLWVKGVKVAEGVLQVDCLLGDKIPEGAAEGVRLAVQGGPNFNKEVSGFTVYIRD